jgi:hypothetical protein
VQTGTVKVGVALFRVHPQPLRETVSLTAAEEGGKTKEERK